MQGSGLILFLSHRTDNTSKLFISQMANFLTIMNLGSGILALLFVTRGNPHLSLLFIFLAALFDSFDGRVARNLNIVSDFGKQLDSLSDLVSFGVAPAFLLYESILHRYHSAGTLFMIIFIICGAIRLARYNTTVFTGSFQGLPITAAGCFLAISYFGIPYFPSYIFMFFVLILSFLMISSLKIKKI